MRSGHRSEEYMADLEKMVFAREWNLPHDSALGMLAYAMVQEQATFLNYRNLRQRVQARGGDPALETILELCLASTRPPITACSSRSSSCS